jgi:hypothetical protein
VSAPFRVTPVVKELGRTRLEAAVSVRALFGPKLFALSVVVLVPVSPPPPPPPPTPPPPPSGLLTRMAP